MKKKPYVIEKRSHPKYRDIIVYTTASKNPLDYLPEIEADIKHIHLDSKSITVIFDTLLYTGNTQERFIKASYSNGTFNSESFAFYEVPKNDDLRQNSLKFYHKHPEMIQNTGVLTSIQRELMLKGFPI